MLFIIFLFYKSYSLHQILFKTNLEKSIIERIKKKINKDKENSKKGHFLKLSSYNKQFIVH